jgi:hypothetical protein
MGCYACRHAAVRHCRLCDSPTCPDHSEQHPAAALTVCTDCAYAIMVLCAGHVSRKTVDVAIPHVAVTVAALG